MRQSAGRKSLQKIRICSHDAVAMQCVMGGGAKVYGLRQIVRHLCRQSKVGSLGSEEEIGNSFLYTDPPPTRHTLTHG